MALPALAACEACAGTGRRGLFGPPGLGLVSLPCAVCAPPDPPDAKAAEALQRQLAALDELRASCNAAFEPEARETRQMLEEIRAAALPAEPSPEPSLRSELWKDIGFQGADPRTDVRTGRFPLEQLHYFAVAHPSTVRRLVVECRQLGCFFAITCFNITHMVLVFFGLLDAAAISPVPSAKPASRQQLANFAGLCALSQQGPLALLNELFIALAERTHAVWAEMMKADGCTVMQFSSALRRTFDEHAAFWNSPRQHLSDVRLLVTERAADPT